ncbi:B12 binding domain-containing protein [Bizionia echini]|uniref:B12 binding domain-containing protein n=1 Tax=Bizionia echini TaxID=649333 RepID=A0A1I5CEK5_9FLAO|nr:MerR family transcriptional regulator [Bizionia echini]SFN85418.1 B12 binding domain-containing protein [Bizionia echini]|tara:strand:+ start:1085 stop:1981 length:897 start_codon:yes stop_codon:yes gene_type:complete
MNNIKNNFSIKDLENLSGVKAHTIRIWEKRYNLLEPNRTETNIRFYSLESLQKLLNITFLYNNGFKISKIAKINEVDIADTVRSLSAKTYADDHATNMFKLAMLNFDKALFLKTYDSLKTHKSFSEIFLEVFIPLMSEIGLLWQTNTITPAQEHFISELIKQKLLINIENHQYESPKNNDKTFVLFLPNNEIHDLGLHFINYKLTKSEYHTIYLGPSVPIVSLKDILKHYKNVTFISYFTVKPEAENIETYLIEFEKELLLNNNELWIFGRMLDTLDTSKLSKSIKPFSSVADLEKYL